MSAWMPWKTTAIFSCADPKVGWFIMVIWSILTPQAWAELQSKRRLRASRRHAEQDYLAPYTWMAEQMDRRLKTPRPSPTVMPLWAWYQWDGPRRRKPDLRAVRFWHPKGERAIRVECQVQDERVLLSDYELWHYVLNYWYLPKTQADGDAFDKKLDAAGFSTCRFTHDNPLPDAYR
jgi:hypothetical protein